MKRVHVASDPVDAELIRSLLATYGVDAIVKGEHLWSLPGIPMTPDGAPSVWVLRDEDEHQARMLIDKHRQTSSAPTTIWRCRICTEENEGGFSNCWKCGAARPLSADQEPDGA
jgi:Putative prokaryotic signal transducing protein